MQITNPRYTLDIKTCKLDQIENGDIFLLTNLCSCDCSEAETAGPASCQQNKVSSPNRGSYQLRTSRYVFELLQIATYLLQNKYRIVKSA